MTLFSSSSSSSGSSSNGGGGSGLPILDLDDDDDDDDDDDNQSSVRCLLRIAIRKKSRWVTVVKINLHSRTSFYRMDLGGESCV